MLLYPLWVRLWHIVNAIVIFILIYTGIRIFFLSQGSSDLILKNGGVVVWHNTASKILIISYIGFVLGNIFTDNGKYYRIRWKTFFQDLAIQIRYNMVGMFRHEKQPFPPSFDSKFNPLQKTTYVVIMYIALPLLIISGIGLMIPEENIIRLFSSRGLVIFDVFHIILGIIVTLFLVIHIYLATIGYRPSTGLNGIIMGYVRSEEE